MGVYFHWSNAFIMVSVNDLQSDGSIGNIKSLHDLFSANQAKKILVAIGGSEVDLPSN